MRTNRGICKIVIAALLILSLSGCWNRRELDELGITMGIGLDKPEESGKVQLTVQVVKPGEIKSSKKEGGGGGEAFWNITDSGDTVFSTLREITSISDRKLFFPHNQVLIFGRGLAEEGVQKCIDFFERDHEERFNVWVVISRENAGDVLNVKSELEKVPAINISKLVKSHSEATSETRTVRLRDFASRLMSKTTSAVAPMIGIIEDGGKKTLSLSGTAVFHGDRMTGELDEIESRGLLWVLGEIKSGIVKVKTSEKNTVGVEIIRAKGKIEPEIKKGKPAITVKINMEGNIGEETGSENLSMTPAVESLEKKTSEVIRSEVMAAFTKARELNADVFGFGDALHRKYPKQWKGMEKKWGEIFPDIAVEVDAQVKIRLMGKINKPMRPEKK